MFLSREHARASLRHRARREAELRRNRGRASRSARVEHDVRANEPVEAMPTAAERPKGECEKCGHYIGRGIGLHRKRCEGAA